MKSKDFLIESQPVGVPGQGLQRRNFLKSGFGAVLGFACGVPALNAETSSSDQQTSGAAAKSNSYYLSSSSGKDEYGGTQKAPWKTLAQISSILLMPGDRVFFKKGDRFDGHFVVKGSGSVGRPVVITAYGTGDKPVITGQVGAAQGGDFREAIYIENFDNIVLDGLEVNNERKTARDGVAEVDAYGVHVINSGTKPMKNFILRNMSFRKVYAVKPMNSHEDFDKLEVAAVRFASTPNTSAGEEKNIQNVLVEHCEFTDIQRLGIHFVHGGGKNKVGNDAINRNADVVVRNNRFRYLGGTCVLPTSTYNCLIENNLFDHPGSKADPRMPGRGSSVWPFHCINTVVQRNVCLGIRGYADSCGIHIDSGNANTFVQYNYMEDCEGGFVEILGGNVNAVYRFNISVNDGWRVSPTAKEGTQGHTLWVSQYFGGTRKEPSDNSYVYNNTVYLDKGFPTSIIFDGKNTFIYNNIFYSGKSGVIGGENVIVRMQDGAQLYVSNNLFYGAIDGQFEKMDKNPVKGDPKFAGPGRDLCRFQLNADSPTINRGIAKEGPPLPGAGTGIFKNLPTYPTVDFYGNPVNLQEGTPNIGACNAKNGSTMTEHCGMPGQGISSE